MGERARSSPVLDGNGSYCDVALPVPVDRPFTYRLPASLRSAASTGCRVLAPFGSRKLTGVIVGKHDHKPEIDTRDIFKLLDAEPVLDSELLALGTWIADYYCAPIGEVLKSMLPLSGEIRKSTLYALTEKGREVAVQLAVRPESDPALRVLAVLKEQPRSRAYLRTKIGADVQDRIGGLVKRGWIAVEELQVSRDPLRYSSERLQAEFRQRPEPTQKLRKAERELIAFLELHPGPHNLADLNTTIRNASEVARALARRDLITLEPEGVPAPAIFQTFRPVLNNHQQAAFGSIREALESGQYKAFLLEGVTGSGKTEVYLRSIEATLALGKNALLLVPEIALTPAVAGQFFHRFGKQVAILHSAFGDSERAEQWRRIKSGNARVIVGTRSGVFAPVRNLGLMIVDEEHDGSYKQQETPRYHGRDVALLRAKRADATVILGSATPSVETRFNAEHGKYSLLSLPERVAQRPMPEVDIVDMRMEFLETKRQNIFSRKLIEQIQMRVAAGEQTMLLLNRRGFSSFMVCRSCGERLLCTNCSVALTHHRKDRRMLCHYCGSEAKIPTRCPACDSDYIQFIGTGSERVEEELHQHVPSARIARLDRDTASAKGAFETILHSFRSGDIDILVGTQMIAKGHDIPNVTLVGVVLADIGLSMPDFRAAERSFQLLTQAAGRAGRGDNPGQVIVQTLNPEHYAVKMAAAQNYESFYQKEIEFRRWLRYPPFAALANVLVRAEKQEEALRKATELGYQLNPAPEGVRVLGPAEAPVLRVKNEYRYQTLVKASKRSTLRGLVTKLRRYAEAQRWNPTSVIFDIDPISLM